MSGKVAFYAHPTAIIHESAAIGAGTKIWQFSASKDVINLFASGRTDWRTLRFRPELPGGE